MSDSLVIRGGDNIKEWDIANPLPIVKEKRVVHDITMYIPRPVLKSGNKAFYFVEHLFHTSSGHPLVLLRRVFSATDAEEALQEYLNEAPNRESGHGTDHVAFKIYEQSPTYSHQYIQVRRLKEGAENRI